MLPSNEKAHVTWQEHRNLTSGSWWRRETCCSSTFIQACFTFCLFLLAAHSSFYILSMSVSSCDHVRWIMWGSSFSLLSHDTRTQPCSPFIQHESMLNVFKMHQSRQLQTCSLCEIDRINGSEDLRLTDIFLTVSSGFYEQTSHDQRRFWETHSVGLVASVPDYKASEITAISSKTIKIFHLIFVSRAWWHLPSCRVWIYQFMSEKCN